jgi:hypothetical protein
MQISIFSLSLRSNPEATFDQEIEKVIKNDFRNPMNWNFTKELP